jgi:hypothetical protein
MNGTEVAIKFPKVKITLRPIDLKKFENEVALQAKVRVTCFFNRSFCGLASHLCSRSATPTACKSSQRA